MYEFHYDYVKNKYCNDSKLLFTDTDSLMCEIKTENVYEDFRSDKELVIGKMNDKAGGVAIEEFVGLKAKMYSFLVENSEHKKGKRCE